MKKLKTLLFFASLTLFLHAQQKPNIIFILADDLGYKDLGCYDNPFIETPVLDQMAKDGMLFTEAYAHPACSPSRAALMTGKHPARLGITTAVGLNRRDPNSPVVPPTVMEELPSSEITMAEILKRNGYSTGMVGKWHLGGNDATLPHGQGFDFDRVIGKNGLDYYNYGISSKGKTIFEDDGSVYLTDKLTDYAVEFIQSQQNEKPFFLFLSYSAPHLYIIPKAELVGKYMRKYGRYDEKYNPYYATMVESMDEGIGRVMDELNRQGMLENTLVIFKSDNGGVGMDQIAYRPTRMEPLRKWKGHVYEGGIRVPMIMNWKNKIEAGTRNSNYVVIEDFLPTFMELTGDGNFPQNIDGKSFLTTIHRPEEKFDRGPVFFHFPHFSGQDGYPAGAVRDGKWKLVENYETGKTELFNLDEDISESNDLKLKEPEKAKELYNLFQQWQTKVGAKMPEKKPDHQY
ncbi:MAG: sulfatase [Bacteroidales bacterium]|nr:sulfatase [Bacteroidales bacterium]